MRIDARILTLLSVVLVAGCAKIGPPPGGPVDKRPPEIIDTVPVQGSTNVDSTVAVEIQFDEPVDHSSLVRAFSLSPPPPGKVRAKWSGHGVTFRFSPSLKKDRTYVLTLGTDLKDLHGNGINDAFHLAFSTGDRLDQGRVDGRLKATGGTQGWSIIGYLLREQGAGDSSGVKDPDPSVDPPDATTQAGVDGSWQLLNLKGGWWRVFAFKDEDGDRLWTPWMESLAVPPYDVEAKEDSTYTPRPLLLVAADRPVLPEVQRASARVRDVIDVQFDRKPYDLKGYFSLEKPPEEELDKLENVTIVPEDEDIRVRYFDYKPGDSTAVRLRLSAMPQGDAVWLRVQGGFGTDEMVDTTLGVVLTQSSSQDTFPPTLISTDPPENSRLHVGRSRLQLLFSEEMQPPPVGGMRLLTGGGDTLLPKVQITGRNRMTIRLDDKTPGGNLVLELLGDSLRDEAGNPMADSSKSFRYIYLPSDSLGKVTGKAEIEDRTGTVYLELWSFSGKDLPLKEMATAVLDFAFPGVPAGDWRLEGWQDREGTGAWYPGKAVPFSPADPYWIATDTVSVRARWESGGVHFIFP